MGAGAEWQHFRPTLILVGLLAALAVLMKALRSATGWFRAAQAELLKDHIGSLILRNPSPRI